MQLEVRSISKHFGEKHVLNNVSFTADQGMALGLLGRNGAGKTTAIRIVMDVFPPDEGEVLFGGHHLRHAGIHVGYLPEERGLYPKIPVGRQLVYLAELRGLTRQLQESRHEALTRLTEAAQAMGANAVLAMRYDSNELMTSFQEILAYGTAVVVEQLA